MPVQEFQRLLQPGYYPQRPLCLFLAEHQYCHSTHGLLLLQTEMKEYVTLVVYIGLHITKVVYIKARMVCLRIQKSGLPRSFIANGRSGCCASILCNLHIFFF